MKINLYIIKDLLKKYLDYKVLSMKISGSLCFCPIDFITDQMYLLKQNRKDILGIISKKEWEKEKNLNKECSYLICNWDNSCAEREGYQYLGICSEYTKNEITIAAQELHKDLNQWEHNLYELLLQGVPMKHLGDASLHLLENPICLYTAGLKNVFVSQTVESARFFKIEEENNQYLSDEELEGLRFNSDFLDTLDQKKPAIFPDEFWGYRILYDNIWEEEIYIARIMTLEIVRPIQDSDYPILRRLAEMIKFAIKRENWSINGHSPFFDQCILELCEGKKMEAEHLERIINPRNWSINHTFFCAVVAVTEEDQRMRTITTLCSKIESAMKGNTVILLPDSFLILFNLTLSGIDRNECIQFMVEILKEYILKAGFSMEFDNLLNLKDYYYQAKQAYLIGNEEKPTIWYYRYEQYEISHLLSNMTADVSLESLLPEGLKKLIKYDEVHERDYTRSLQVYLQENMSVAAAIKKLYIQKSTFVYQLKRIQEITGVSFNNDETRLLYLLLFKCMEKQNQKKERGEKNT